MFWNKEKPMTEELTARSLHCQNEAEQLYRSGSHHCAEAVLESVRKHYAAELPASIVGAVSGFGGGSGVGCLCGAVAGGAVALGMVVGDKKKTSALTKDLHVWFKEKYGVTCCKTIKQTHRGACPTLTGEVAGKVGEMLSHL